MKLLLDENLSKRLVPFLQHDFPGSTQLVLLDNKGINVSSLVIEARASIELIT
jgi:predicted nuclease of predicted toxin-antitoxin system